MKGILFSFLIFTSLSVFAQAPLIIGGKSLEANDLPQVQGISGCTASLIGPRVIITAGHCVWKPEGTFTVGGRVIPVGNMKINPAYKVGVNLPHDFAYVNDNAVGILETPITDRVPLTIAKEVPQPGETILFAGMGMPRAGVRQYGFSTVWLVSENGLSLAGKDTKVALDSGDSGGPTFIRHADGHVEIMGVNSTSSRTFDQWGVPAYTSGIARVNNSQAIAFLKNYAAEHNVEICGINLDCAPVYFKKN